jgi:hypothetical protein
MRYLVRSAIRRAESGTGIDQVAVDVEAPEWQAARAKATRLFHEELARQRESAVDLLSLDLLKRGEA